MASTEFFDGTEETFEDEVEQRISVYESNLEITEWLKEDYDNMPDDYKAATSKEDHIKSIATICQLIFDKYEKEVDPRRLPNTVLLQINLKTDLPIFFGTEEEFKEWKERENMVGGEDGERSVIIPHVALDGTVSHDKVASFAIASPFEFSQEHPGEATP